MTVNLYWFSVARYGEFCFAFVLFSLDERKKNLILIFHLHVLKLLCRIAYPPNNSSIHPSVSPIAFPPPPLHFIMPNMALLCVVQ